MSMLLERPPAWAAETQGAEAEAECRHEWVRSAGDYRGTSGTDLLVYDCRACGEMLLAQPQAPDPMWLRRRAQRR